MKKKVIAVLLAVLTLTVAAVTVFAADTPAYTVDEATGNITLDVEIILYGDATKDGKVDIKDINQLNRYMKGLASIFNSLSGEDKDYRIQVADVTGDGVVNIKDINQINRYVNGLPSVFDTFAK